MQLIVKRTHEQLNETWYYILTTRLELTEEEQDLVLRYKLEEHTLTPGDAVYGTYSPSTISSQMQGSRRLERTLLGLEDTEQSLREACAKLPVLFDYCRSFDVDQVFEY
jgi:hypothetical protein